jgi:PTS system N-acetylgalactosamine-specific IIA component
MLSALEQITGRGDIFLGVTNKDLSAQDVEALLRQQLAETNAVVIFTDLPAGSCTMTARRLQRERPDLKVVTGVNLSTLLDFAFTAESGDANAVEHAADKGRASLVVTGGSRGA